MQIINNTEDVFFKETVTNIIDMEIQYLFQTKALSMREQLALYLFRVGEMLLSQADLFDKDSKGVARVRLSEFCKKGYTKSRQIDMVGFSKTGVSTKGRKGCVHIVTRKGILFAKDILQKYHKEFISSQNGKEASVDMNRIGLSPADFWNSEKVTYTILEMSYIKGRSLRLHDVTEKPAYLCVIMNSPDEIRKFSVEQRYDGSGACTNKITTYRSGEYASMLRSDAYFSFTNGDLSNEYMLEHDMCSEKIEAIGEKINQYCSTVLAPRIHDSKKLPTILFSISTMLCNKKEHTSSFERQGTEEKFVKSQVNKGAALSISTIANLIADKLSDDSRTVSSNDGFLTLGLVKRLIGHYSTEKYLDFLDQCSDIWGDSILFSSIEERFSEEKALNRPPTDFMADKKREQAIFLSKRRKEIYNLCFNMSELGAYFRLGLSLFCFSIENVSGAMGAVLDQPELIKSILANFHKKDINATVQRSVHGFSFELKNQQHPIFFPNVLKYNFLGKDRFLVAENLTSDVGALYRLNMIMNSMSAPLPFVFLLVYCESDLLSLDHKYRNLIKRFINSALQVRSTLLSCEYKSNGFCLSYGDVLIGGDLIMSLIK